MFPRIPFAWPLCDAAIEVIARRLGMKCGSGVPHESSQHLLLGAEAQWVGHVEANLTRSDHVVLAHEVAESAAFGL